MLRFLSILKWKNENVKIKRNYDFYSGIPNLVCTGKSVVGDASGGSFSIDTEYFLVERKGCTEEK